MTNHYLTVALSSHRGKRREQNEDAVGYRHPDNVNQLSQHGSLFLLADGVAGVVDGEYASDMSIRIIMEQYFQCELATPSARLVQAITEANRILYAKDGVGATTIVVAAIHEDTLTIANVGDSPAYWIEADGSIVQLTEDHVRFLDPAQPKKRKLTRALGHKPQVQIDTVNGPLAPGGRLLMVSDGATRYLSMDDFAEQYIQQMNPRDTTIDIIRRSIMRGGGDNISAVVVDIGPPAPDANQLIQHFPAPNEVFVVLPDPLPESTSQPPSPGPEQVAVVPILEPGPPDPQPVMAPKSVIEQKTARRSIGCLRVLAVILLVGMIATGWFALNRDQDKNSASTVAIPVENPPTRAEVEVVASPTLAEVTSESANNSSASPMPLADTTAPAGPAALPATVQPTISLIPDLPLNKNDRVRFSDSALTYNGIGNDVAAFVISPQKIYTIRQTYTSIRDQKVWYQLYDMANDQTGWVGEEMLPEYEKVD